MGPSEELDPIRYTIFQLMENIKAHGSWGYYFDCPRDYSILPSVEILFGGYWM